MQRGERLGLPHARPMAAIGARCGELRIPDETKTWRIMFRTDPDAIVIADVFEKKTAKTPASVIVRCKRRLRAYDEAAREGGD